jgi:hypothetical protein
VTDAGHHRNAAASDGARNAFIVESPQILERTAPAREDQYVALGAGRGQIECSDNGARRAIALNRNRMYQHPRRGEAACKHIQDVANRSSAGRGDHTDDARRGRQRTLALGCKQSLRLELGLELVERALQCAEAGVLQVLDHQLILAALLVQAHAAASQQHLAFARRKARQNIARAVHAAAQLRVTVFQ